MVTSLKSTIGEPLRFTAVGAINTLTSLAIIYSTKFFLSFDDVTANFLGYIVGLTVSFVLNSKWTFKYDAAMLPTALKFSLAFILSYILNILLVITLIRHVGFNDYLSHLAGILVYSAAFFLLCKLYVFRRRAGGRPAGTSIG